MFDWTAEVFTGAPEDARTHVITCAAADPKRRAEAEKVAEVIVAGQDRVEPAAALQALAERGYQTVLCEGGPTWLGELVAADRLDELCLTIAPLMGGDLLPGDGDAARRGARNLRAAGRHDRGQHPLPPLRAEPADGRPAT